MRADFSTGLKICSCCKQEKSINEFYKSKAYSDGLKCICKQCSLKKTREYLKTEKGKAMVSRFNNSAKTKERKRLWWENKTEEEKDKYRKKSRERAAKKRIMPPKKEKTLSKKKIASMEAEKKRLKKEAIANDRVSRGVKFCACCGQEKPFSEFCKKSKYKDGLDYTCKDCANKARKKREELKKKEILSKTFFCEMCEQERPMSEYHYKNGERYKGMNICKSCYVEIKIQDKRAYSFKENKKRVDNGYLNEYRKKRLKEDHAFRLYFALRKQDKQRFSDYRVHGWEDRQKLHGCSMDFFLFLYRIVVGTLDELG